MDTADSMSRCRASALGAHAFEVSAIEAADQARLAEMNHLNAACRAEIELLECRPALRPQAVGVESESWRVMCWHSNILHCQTLKGARENGRCDAVSDRQQTVNHPTLGI